MNRRGVLVVQAMLVWALSASAVVKNSGLRITVLDEETHLVVLNYNPVPKNCDPANFDAYCHNSRTTVMTNTLLVQEDDKEPYRVTCTVETIWSHCKPLLKGYSFDAKKEKRGLLIYYLDEAGKLRKQLYTYVNEEKTAPAAAAATGAHPDVSAPPGVQAIPAPSAAGERQAEKCSFTSTPSGADISVDGKYVGSTPSILTLTPGTHDVVISMSGFALWKRVLTVSPDSQVTVNAILQQQ